MRNWPNAPYSGYSVGAALISEAGIFTGVNVENVSYGATICAERSAIVAMAAAGGRAITRLVVFTPDGGSPCGICLQVIAEFAGPELPILLVSADRVERVRLADLFPRAFASGEVGRAQVSG